MGRSYIRLHVCLDGSAICHRMCGCEYRCVRVSADECASHTPTNLKSNALTHTHTCIELPAKLLDYILRRNESNINQSDSGCISVTVMLPVLRCSKMHVPTRVNCCRSQLFAAATARSLSGTPLDQHHEPCWSGRQCQQIQVTFRFVHILFRCAMILYLEGRTKTRNTLILIYKTHGLCG